jgi:hypothetical protein
MIMHKVIVTLAAAMMILFLMTSHFEPEFFLLHFYQSAIYLIIVLLFFYFEDRWGYMFGILVPVVWIILNFLTGFVSGSARQLFSLVRTQRVSNPVSLLGGVILILGASLAILSFVAFRKGVFGTGKAWRTFIGSFIWIAVYYGVLIYWFVRTIPS